MERTLIVLALALLVALYQIGAEPEAAPIVQASTAGGEIVAATARQQWAVDFAAAVGNSAPSAEIIALLVAWQGAENTTATFNPIATSQDMPGATIFNGDGVKNYASYQDGIDATARTLTYSYAGYADMLAGIQQNDAQRAFSGLYASPWGTNADNVQALYASALAELEQSPPAAPVDMAFAAQVSSSTLTASGDFGTNVRAALNANGGAIQNFTIQPGETWSFGHSIAPISAMGYLPNVGGNPGGGWCDLGALYVEVADQLGLESGVPPHGAGYGPRFPGILLDENGNGADLTITNTRPEPIAFHVIIDGDTFRVEAGSVQADVPATVGQASECPVDPCWQSGTGYSSGHPGVDLGASMGQAVYATMDGVAHTSTSWPCGNGLSITNGDTMTLMCHLSGYTVADGAEVRAGEQVAQAGSSGQSTGPHVHFEIRQNGINLDPSYVLGM